MTTTTYQTLILVFISVALVIEIIKEFGHKAEKLIDDDGEIIEGKTKFSTWINKWGEKFLNGATIFSIRFIRTVAPALCIHLVACLFYIIVAKRPDVLTGVVPNVEIISILSAFFAWFVYIFYNILWGLKKTQNAIIFIGICAIVPLFIAGFMLA